MGTGEFIMVCSSDSLKACDGRVTVGGRPCRGSTDAGPALVGMAPGVGG